MKAARQLALLADEVAACTACSRLVAWRTEVAATKRVAFADQTYWGRGVPGFGDPAASVLLVGLAPAAHGANRTGRMFTGDRSGDFLYGSLHRCGFANQPTATATDDGLELRGAYVTAAVRCAPPANKPSTTERDNCGRFLRSELALLANVRVIVALGGFAFGAMCAMTGLRPRPAFGHGAVVPLDGLDGSARQATEAAAGLTHLVGCYHPSQQNTFTGRLTPAMLDDVLSLAGRLANPTGNPA